MDNPVPPLVGLLSDFGTADHYVAAMKAAVLGQCPTARLIDVTHHVPRHDVRRGSFLLERAIDAFPAGTVHLAVVDPGVGTSRLGIVAAIAGQQIVCPDNGLLTWAWRRHDAGRRHQIVWRPPREASPVFHGRDLFGPVAGRLAAGAAVAEVAQFIGDPLLLPDLFVAPHGVLRGHVVTVDAFGNATTNVPEDVVRGRGPLHFAVNGQDVGPLQRTYADVPVGTPLALIGSSGLLEIAVREGSAAEVLGLREGDAIELLGREPG